MNIVFKYPLPLGSFDIHLFIKTCVSNKQPVAFIILPIFALANTAIVINGNLSQTITENYSLGIASGLIIGKPIGIFLFTLLGVIFGICKLPQDVNWKSIFGVGLLGGIGFTMSIFVTLLAYDNELIINNSKLIKKVFG